MAFLLNPFVFGGATLREFQGSLVLGTDTYTEQYGPVGFDEFGEPIYEYQTFTAIGFNTDAEEFRPGGITFGSLEPSSYGPTSFTSFYYESSFGDYSGSTGIKIVRSGPDTTGAYPTINHYPLVNSPVVTTANFNDRIVNIGQHVFETKYSVGSSVTLRFALRTDILDTVGSGTVTVPTGATRAIIVAIGGGGGGARVASGATRRGGGGAATSISDISVSPSDWGTNISYTVGNFGLGRTSTSGSGTSGTASTVVGLGLSMTAGGGGGATTTAYGVGGTASGGNLVNDAGVTGNSDIDWTTPRDIAYAKTGSGGFGGVASNGVNGIQGIVTIVWY